MARSSVYVGMSGRSSRGGGCLEKGGGEPARKLMHAHPVEQGALGEEATTLSVHPFLTPCPCRSQSSQPRRMEAVAKAFHSACVQAQLSFLNSQKHSTWEWEERCRSDFSQCGSTFGNWKI